MGQSDHSTLISWGQATWPVQCKHGDWEGFYSSFRPIIGAPSVPDNSLCGRIPRPPPGQWLAGTHGTEHIVVLTAKIYYKERRQKGTGHGVKSS